MIVRITIVTFQLCNQESQYFLDTSREKQRSRIRNANVRNNEREIPPGFPRTWQKSEIKIERRFFVRDRERNWRSSGGGACVATKDDNNINALSTRPSSRDEKKASKNEQLVDCSPPGHNRNVSRTRAERVCLDRPVRRASEFLVASLRGLRLPVHPRGESDLSTSVSTAPIYSSSRKLRKIYIISIRRIYFCTFMLVCEIFRNSCP